KRKNKRPQSNHSRPRLESLEERNLMAGDLDATFAFGWGQTVTDFGGRETLTDMVVQTDGKIVAVGQTNFGGSGQNFALARYNIDGSLDSSFGGEGVVADGMTVTDFDNNGDTRPSVLVLDDGSIMVAGTSNTDPDGTIILAKYTPGGVLDEGFGDDGRVAVAGWSEVNDVNEMLVAEDKILLVANKALIRLNLDGSSDTSFGGDGTIHRDDLSIDGSFITGHYHAGRYVFGISSTQPRILMLNSDGTTDASFGTNGLATHSFTGWVHSRVSSVKLEDDGAVIGLVTRGSTKFGSDPIVFKLDADGQELASSFHVDGKFELSGLLDRADNLVVQPQGSIVISGMLGDQMGVVRLTPDGDLDTNFAEDGVRTTYGGGGELSATVNYADGKIVVGGTSGQDFFLMRLTGDEYESQFDGPGGLQRPQGTHQPTRDQPERDPDCDTNPLTTVCDLADETPIEEQKPDRHLDLIPGDTDGDGDADFSDFLRIANNFGSQKATRADGDMDGDKDVDFADFLAFAGHFGKQRDLAAAAGAETTTSEVAAANVDHVFARGSVLPVGFRVGGLETDESGDDTEDNGPDGIIWDIDVSTPTT
ncbi:MAG: delta-60 repeat domain-containing protein, partial [Planctomycetota bacterium]